MRASVQLILTFSCGHTCVHHLEKFANTAMSQSQAAYAALMKSLQFEWVYPQLVISNCATAFTPLSHTVCESFLPAMMGGSTYFRTRGSSSIPCRANGWDEDSRSHTISSLCLQHLKRYHSNQPLSKKNGILNASTRWGTSKNTYETTWRTADQQSCPLPAATFIRVFYRVLLCPSFALPSNVLEHALDCKKGGLVIQRNNIFRDALGNYAIWHTGSNKGANSERAWWNGKPPCLVANLGVRQVWQPQTE